MTIALALRADDGSLVMAADTLVSHGALKVRQSKFRLRYDDMYAANSGACAIAASGHMDHATAAAELLLEVFEKSRNLHDSEIREAMESRLVAFYQQHMDPLVNYPPQERPNFQLLIGLRRNGGMARLFVTADSTIRDEPLFACVGYGAGHASGLIHRLWANVPMTETAYMAAYSMYVVKETVQDCGKYTEIILFPGPEADMQQGPMMTYMGQELIQACEKRIQDEYEPEELSSLHEFLRKVAESCP